MRLTGTVKRFNNIKRYGFIQPDDGSGDVFIHIMYLYASGLTALKEGQKVSFVPFKKHINACLCATEIKAEVD